MKEIKKGDEFWRIQYVLTIRIITKFVADKKMEDGWQCKMYDIDNNFLRLKTIDESLLKDKDLFQNNLSDAINKAIESNIKEIWFLEERMKSVTEEIRNLEQLLKKQKKI